MRITEIETLPVGVGGGYDYAVILVLVRRDRRTIHDLLADTAVVYSWDARSARLRVLARRDPVGAVEAADPTEPR